MSSANKRSVLLVATIAAFLTPFMGSAINIALPTIGREFGADAISLGWVSTAYLLAAAVFLVPMGRLADIHGRKRIFVLGVSVYAVSTLLSAAATSAPMLIICRAVEGAGSAMIFGTSMAILTSAYPPAERGQALGINVAAVYVGLSIGPTAGGLLTQALGWRSVFLATMPLACLVIAVALWQLKGEWAEARGEPFDLPGAAIYALGLVALMYGFSELPATLGFALVALGLAGLAGFAAWEARVASPVLDLSLFRHNTVFALSNLAALFNYSATYAVGFLLSLYLQYIKGYTPQGAGLLLICQPLVQAAFSPLAGRLSDRVQPRIVASIGMALTVAGLALLTFLSAATPLGYLIAALVLLGLGFAFFSSPNTNSIMGSVEKRLYGVASGTVSTMRLLGQMLSMGTAMLVFALYMGRVEVTPAQYPQFISSARLLFGVFAVLCSAGVFASLARGNLRRGEARGA